MTVKPMIRLAEQDYSRLKHLVAELTHQSRDMQAGLAILEEVLDRASVVRPEVRDNVGTMSSRVLFQDVRTQAEER